MQDPDVDGPSAAELAVMEAELPEWDRLVVRDYWDAVVAAESGTPVSAMFRPEPSPPEVRAESEQRPMLRLLPGDGAVSRPSADDAGRAA